MGYTTLPLSPLLSVEIFAVSLGFAMAMGWTTLLTVLLLGQCLVLAVVSVDTGSHENDPYRALRKDGVEAVGGGGEDDLVAFTVFNGQSNSDEKLPPNDEELEQWRAGENPSTGDGSTAEEKVEYEMSEAEKEEEKLVREITDGLDTKLVDSEVFWMGSGAGAPALEYIERQEDGGDLPPPPSWTEEKLNLTYGDDFAKKTVKIMYYLENGACDTLSYPYDRERAKGCVTSCSGAMISPLHVVTAAHCVTTMDGKGYSNFRVIPAMTDIRDPVVTSGYDYFVERPYGVARVQSVFKYGNALRVENDLAILTLDRPIGHVTGYFSLAKRVPKEDTTLETYGYPSTLVQCTDKGGDNQWKRSFNVHQMYWDYMLKANVEQCGGDSGAPVIDPVSGELYGVLSRGYNGGCGSCGVGNFFRIIRDVDQVTEKICSDFCSCPGSDKTTCVSPVDRPDVWDAQRTEDIRFPKYINPRRGEGCDVSARKFKAAITFVNTGLATSGSLTISFYASEVENVHQNQGTFLGAFKTRNSLASLQYATVEQDLQLPQGAGPGPWFISAVYMSSDEEYAREFSLRIAYISSLVNTCDETTPPTASPTPTPTPASKNDSLEILPQRNVTEIPRTGSFTARFQVHSMGPRDLAITLKTLNGNLLAKRIVTIVKPLQGERRVTVTYSSSAEAAEGTMLRLRAHLRPIGTNYHSATALDVASVLAVTDRRRNVHIRAQTFSGEVPAQQSFVVTARVRTNRDDRLIAVIYDTKNKVVLARGVINVARGISTREVTIRYKTGRKAVVGETYRLAIRLQDESGNRTRATATTVRVV